MDRRLARSCTLAIAVTLGFSACTSTDDTPEDGTGVVGTIEAPAGTATTSERLPFGEDPDDASTTDDVDAPTSTGAGDDPETTTVPDGDQTTSTEAPPGTTTAEATTVPPATEPTAQDPDTALACASVEIGLLRFLTDGSGLDDMESGAQQAQQTGVVDYVELGAELEALLDRGDAGSESIADAADALLARCAEDGFERLT